MKKAILPILFLLTIHFAGAQNAKEIFTGQSMVWYGLDFSKAHLIGVTDEKPEVIKNDYLESWNQPMIYERDRFPLASIFRKPTVRYNLDVVKARNKSVATNDLFGKDESIITTATIENMISQYPVGAEKQGLGVVFVIESFNKKKKEAFAHIVFFDIASHKVLFAKRMRGEPGGGGLKNYWANAIGQMMDQISKTLWPIWEKEVNSKN